MSVMENEKFNSLVDFLKSGKINISEISSTTDEYKQFIAAFPPSSIDKMTLEQYCMGTGNNNSFSWWLERGLEPVLGRYSPGTAKGHLLYYDKDKTLYKNRRLKKLSDSDALNLLLKVISTIANADISNGYDWVTDKAEVLKRAQLEDGVFGGTGRILRILNCYHPDQVLPICSSDHLAHFLKLFGVSEQGVSKRWGAAKRLSLLDEVYREAAEQVPGLTRLAFMRAIYSDDLGLHPKNYGQETTADEDEDEDLDSFEIKEVKPSLNTILYGPPGTGKTYNTINEALRVIDPEYLAVHAQDRSALKQRFDDLMADGQIRLVTFHQSFSYEDFVEGIKADTDEQGNIVYEVSSGIFKDLCDKAKSRLTISKNEDINLQGRAIWKMSLGNTLGSDAFIYQECIDNGYALLGYGDQIDFSGCKTKDDILQRFVENKQDIKSSDYAMTAVSAFVLKVKPGDIVVVTDGNQKFRAIGEFTGDYKCMKRQDPEEGYGQCRMVNWLRVYSPSLLYEQVMNNCSFSQATIYRLHPGQSIDLNKLNKLLSSEAENDDKTPKPHVLIIDEINRGNISRIFGELITLVEPSKREGAAEALSVNLPYSKKSFSVPSNVYLIGTMNTADRSLAGLDIALRRRFTFKEMPPLPKLLDDIEVEGLNIGKLLSVMNERIEVLLDRDHCLGHAYFLPLGQDSSIEQLAFIFEHQILPLLQEYFFEDWERIRWVLNDHRKPADQQFIQPGKTNLASLFDAETAAKLQDRRWCINKIAFDVIGSYRGILGANA